MIRVLIVEDEPYIRKGLIELIESIDQNLFILGECGTVREAITVTEASKPDLIFLDINLPDGDGFDFLDQTRSMQLQVIFITAHEKYALKAIKHGAVDYILKPIDIEELEAAIGKAMKLINSKNVYHKPISSRVSDEKLIISLQESFEVIRLKDLTYCHSDKGYTTFHLVDGKQIMASKPLKEYEEKLINARFVRTHQSYFVNLDFIERYDKADYAVVLKSGKKIPVSTRKRDAFLSIFLR